MERDRSPGVDDHCDRSIHVGNFSQFLTVWVLSYWLDVISALKSHPSITHLDLSHCNLGKKDCALLGEALKVEIRCDGRVGVILVLNIRPLW